MDAPPAKPRFKSVPLILPISYNYNPATNEVSASDRKAKGLKPVEEGVRILSSIRGPVAVISIVGAYRKGKSYGHVTRATLPLNTVQILSKSPAWLE